MTMRSRGAFPLCCSTWPSLPYRLFRRLFFFLRRMTSAVDNHRKAPRSYLHPAGFAISSPLRLGVLCLLAVVLGSATSPKACDVPVHRYILQRWEREPYRAYYFCRGREDSADRAVNELLEDAASSFGSHVNITFRAVDVNRLNASPLAEPDRTVWNQHRSDKLPFHLVLSPRDTALFCGRLDLPTATAMIRSPARTYIARELGAGKGGLLLLLDGDDNKQNELAEKDVRWVLSRSRDEHGLDVAFLRLSRKDPDEKWLVRFLLDAAGDPPDAGQPIVFVICGRGRVLAASLGKEINRRNLVECVRIMNGDCSCELKAMDVGMDLLTDWDWEGAIANLPPVNVEPMRSALLGFDDSGESRPDLSPPAPAGKRTSQTAPLFRARTLRNWAVAFGIVSLVVVGAGLIITRRRRET